MANGKKGDHPITDIVDWGMEVYGDPIDSLIKELYEDGRGYELTTEIAFWNGVSPVEIEGELRAMANRRPSARVEFYFEPKVANRYGLPGHGWVFRGAIQFVDPDVALEQTWTVLFLPDPMHFDDGRIVATARPTCDDAPPGLLAPGRGFWIRGAANKLAHGRVFSEREIPI